MDCLPGLHCLALEGLDPKSANSHVGYCVPNLFLLNCCCRFFFSSWVIRVLPVRVPTQEPSHTTASFLDIPSLLHLPVSPRFLPSCQQCHRKETHCHAGSRCCQEQRGSFIKHKILEVLSYKTVLLSEPLTHLLCCSDISLQP